jgi:hypothetical protein
MRSAMATHGADAWFILSPHPPMATRWRDAQQNLRTGLLRILRRAGVKSWPRLYQNLRSSRETELAERFPIHVVAEWLGNSPKTALAHYTQVTEDHFKRATSRDAAQNQAQQTAALACIASQRGGSDMTEDALLQGLATLRKSLPDKKMTPTGFEPVSRP